MYIIFPPFFLKQANTYIENIRSKYGCFNYAENRTPFVLEKMNEYIKQMITKPEDANSIHLPIWAKHEENGYYPAKYMFSDDDKMLHVRIFGAHESTEVTPQECFLYSEQNPDESDHDTDKVYRLASDKSVKK